jgi:hypothetical protein
MQQCHGSYPGCTLLRLVKVLLEYGLSGHSARTCRLGWFGDESDSAILLLRLLLMPPARTHARTPPTILTSDRAAAR